MIDKIWLDYAVAFGSIATPLLVLLLTAIGWRARTNVERRIELENKLRDDRIEIYNQILEPFIIILMSDTAWHSDKKFKSFDKTEYGTNKMLSLEYRKLSFKLGLMAPDDVVRSYNNLMQYFYNSDANDKKSTQQNAKETLELLGLLLIEIRKSMGNEATKLNAWDMCEWWMSDTRNIKNIKF